MSTNLDSMACENDEYKKKHKEAKRTGKAKTKEIKSMKEEK